MFGHNFKVSNHKWSWAEKLSADVAVISIQETNNSSYPIVLIVRWEPLGATNKVQWSLAKTLGAGELLTTSRSQPSAFPLRWLPPLFKKSLPHLFSLHALGCVLSGWGSSLPRAGTHAETRYVVCCWRQVTTFSALKSIPGSKTILRKTVQAITPKQWKWNTAFLRLITTWSATTNHTAKSLSETILCMQSCSHHLPT